MTRRDMLDEADVCAIFASRTDSDGYSEAELKAAMHNLLAQGVIRRVPYRAQDGSVRYKIEESWSGRHAGRFGRA